MTDGSSTPQRTRGRSYLDLRLDLRDLDEKADTFAISLSGPQIGDSGVVSSRYAPSELEDSLYWLADRNISEQDLIVLGEGLSDRLLPEGEIRTQVKAALNTAGRDGGVRLRLVIRDPLLAQLPWEYAYLQWHQGEKDSRHFLVLDPRVSIVRHEALGEAQPFLAGADPTTLRVVATTANVPAPGLPRLNLKKERKVIEEALRDLRVDGVTARMAEFLENPTPEQLETALIPGADVFHFAGHGVFEDVDTHPGTGRPVGKGHLLLAAEDGTAPAPLAAAKLAKDLSGAKVRLAVLGACDSGRRDGVTAWTAVAPALVEQGVGAVVAMQYQVVDEKAIAFARAFYTALATGLSVDEAVMLGRLAMYDPDDPDWQWGVPVLYMRAVDGVVFPELAGRASKTGDAVRVAISESVDLIDKTGEVVGIGLVRAGDKGGQITVELKATTVKGTMIGIKELNL
jgi:CHAT domain